MSPLSNKKSRHGEAHACFVTCSEYDALLYCIKSHAVVEKEGALPNPTYYVDKSHSVSTKASYSKVAKYSHEKKAASASI